ncbi:MAG: aminotransferase class IV [Pirellulales bacterium]|nr:aminotransferase class IV [Pirellulales bacterium]
MPEPIAYLNGQLLPVSAAAIPVFDSGFVLGATATEQLRTFRGELFRLPEHLQRLHRSLAIMGVQPRESIADLADISQRLVRHNIPLIDRADDLGLCIFVTPGPYAAMAEGHRAGPTVGLHTYRLPFFLWAKMYDEGVSLATTSVEQVPTRCWPAELKCRSRIHYFLADRQAAIAHPGARAVLHDEGGHLTETSTANIILYFEDEGLVSPPKSQVLPGISLQVVHELAGRLQIPSVERPIHPPDFAHCHEAFITSTPNCLLPVTRFNGEAVGHGRRGDVFQSLISAWNELVGLDIAEQARRFANR